MSDPDDFEYLERPNPAANALVYGLLGAWATLLLCGGGPVIWKWWPF